MIFCGRHHPIFDDFIASPIISSTNIVDTQLDNKKGKFFLSNELKNGQKYFFHSEVPLIDPSLDIEYVFNIEDQMTMIKNVDSGKQHLVDLTKYSEMDYIRYVLEDPRCKKIVCHIEKMAQALPNLLKSEVIREKTVFEKIGIKPQPEFKKTDNGEFVLLFTNSYHDWDQSFSLRGGEFLLETVKYLINIIPNLKVIIRSNIPRPFDVFLNNDPRIEVYSKKLSDAELDKLYKRADLVVLPSVRVHSHSICRAFSHGIPVLGSDGWGNDEFIEHDYNGLIVQGFDKASWHDKNIGCMENYNNSFTQNATSAILKQMYQYILYLYEHPKYLNTLKENARKTCLEKYSLSNWEKWKI